jgi:hypothetical protein
MMLKGALGLSFYFSAGSANLLICRDIENFINNVIMDINTPAHSVCVELGLLPAELLCDSVVVVWPSTMDGQFRSVPGVAVGGACNRTIHIFWRGGCICDAAYPVDKSRLFDLDDPDIRVEDVEKEAVLIPFETTLMRPVFSNRQSAYPHLHPVCILYADQYLIELYRDTFLYCTGGDR